MYSEARLLVIDDEDINLTLVERVLRRAGYTSIRCVSDAHQAPDAYLEFRPDLILLDLHMPGRNGFEVLQDLRPLVDRDLVPVIVLTGDPSIESTRLALSSGARDFISKPFELVELTLRVRNLLEMRFAHLSMIEQKEHLEERVRERTRELANAELATLQLLARAAEFRDDETGRHTQRVGSLSARLAQQMGLDTDTVEIIRNAAPLHDIGKIGVPDNILLKPSSLTMEERGLMQRHAEIGADILDSSDFPILRAAREIAYSHHERWDGGGYPRGLSGTHSPLSARIVAVADVFDALSHDRPYRARLPLGEVLAFIQSGSGAHFDPAIVDALASLVERSAPGEGDNAMLDIPHQP